MKISHQNYQIEITDDRTYTSGSTDNVKSYQHTYSHDSSTRPSAQHGIKVTVNEEEIASAIIFGYGGSTCVHTNSSLVLENTLLLCCGNRLFALEISTLIKLWDIPADDATCFGIYYIKNAIIVHGELAISRIDIEGNILWSFAGGDIFVHQEKESFEIFKDHILLTDWEDNTYLLDLDGKQVSYFDI